ncbi:MAG: hypothetical protein ACM3N3_15065 [Betaproteobacteria bacterium]
MSSTLGFRARIYAIAIKQEVHYVMDEPFAPLDAIVRTRITQELLHWVEREHCMDRLPSFPSNREWC